VPFAFTVKSVKGSIAIVELISTADRKTEGILVRTEMAIVIDGIGGGAFEFIAPESFDVEVGDLVVTPGSSRFAIGRVVEKKSESSGSFVNVLLEQKEIAVSLPNFSISDSHFHQDPREYPPTEYWVFLA